MKIAMLGHKRIPSREGGVEIVVEELAMRMVKLGHNVTVYNRSGNHVSGKEYDIEKPISEYKGIKIKNVPTIDKRGLAAMSSSFFASLKSAFSKYDVIHFHAEGPCAFLWITKLFRKKCIVTIHGLDHQRQKWGKFAKAFIMLGEKCAVKYADNIIVLSKNVQNYFRNIYGRETVFIPNGVNRPEIKGTSFIEEKYNLDKDGYILYLGRIVPEKGIHYLIDSFKQIDTKKKLVIAGGSSDTDEYMKEIVEMSIADERILFTGFVQGEVLDELYSNAYIYVLPSDLEGMPLSLLEAMSYGNCCLTSDISECTEVIENKAITFKKGNIEDLKCKLQDLCDNPEKVKRFKEKASDFICEKYNWDTIVNQTILLYKE